MKYNYQGKDITKKELINKIGTKVFMQVQKMFDDGLYTSFNIDIDIFRGGILIIKK